MNLLFFSIIFCPTYVCLSASVEISIAHHLATIGVTLAGDGPGKQPTVKQTSRSHERTKMTPTPTTTTARTKTISRQNRSSIVLEHKNSVTNNYFNLARSNSCERANKSFYQMLHQYLNELW